MTKNNDTRKPTIRDVAREIGVSVATISRVINDQPGVGQKTRERVQTLLKDYGYTANQQAQHLATGRSKLIGVAFPFEMSEVFLQPVYSALLGAINDAANQRGHAVLLANHSGNIADTVDLLRRHNVDGVIFPAATKDDPLLAALPQISARSVLIGHRSNRDTANWVDCDHETAAHDLARHLLDAGCKRLLHLAGPEAVSAVVLRCTGVERAVAKYGDALDSFLTTHVPFTSDAGEAWALNYLSGHNRPDAIICGNDDIASGVLRAARKLGLDLPRELAVTGFDDLGIATHTEPQLTTVRMPLEKIGAAAVSVLLDEGKSSDGERILLETEILYRASTETDFSASHSNTLPNLKGTKE